MSLLRRRKIRQKKRNREPRSLFWHVFYGVLAMLVVVLLAVATWYLSRLEAVTIVDIEVSGGETISHSELKALVNEELTGTYILLIPHRFSLLYPHDAIVNRLENVPRVHDVNVDRVGHRKLSITFKEYLPYALWCLDVSDNAPCYFISRDGYAFAPAPPLRGGALVRHIVEGKGELGEEQILERDTLEETDIFLSILKHELNFRIRSITYTKDGDVIYGINGGGDLLVAPSMKAETTFLNLQSILTSDEFGHIAPGNFNYIDLRFGNKVFVNEELEVATSTPTTTEEVAEISETPPET